MTLHEQNPDVDLVGVDFGSDMPLAPEVLARPVVVFRTCWNI
ncbi:hypothetical protein [Actinoalloteichus caeruleus]